MSGLSYSGAGDYRARRWWRRPVVVLAVLLPWGAACYRQVPVWNGVPSPGQEVTIGLSDQGRSVLAAKIGPGARRVSGRVVDVSDSALTIGVTGVQYIASGSMTRWNGERVTVPRGFLSGMEERQLSKRRTWIAVGVVTAAVVMASFIAISGFGQGESVERPLPNPEPQ